MITQLNTALKIALKDPEFIKKQEGLGAVVVTDKRVEPAVHKAFVAAEIAKLKTVIDAVAGDGKNNQGILGGLGNTGLSPRPNLLKERLVEQIDSCFLIRLPRNLA